MALLEKRTSTSSLWAETRGPLNYKSETRTNEVKEQECRIGLNLKYLIVRRGGKEKRGPEEGANDDKQV